jgi:hypothetical protein
MTETGETLLPADLASELERQFFWWEPVGSRPRSHARILAQAMDFAPFEDVRRLETVVGADRLLDVMVRAEPGWLSDRSWEFWRGRLRRATGRDLPEEPPRRTLDAAAV